jgi:hypothetical protein
VAGALVKSEFPRAVPEARSKAYLARNTLSPFFYRFLRAGLALGIGDRLRADTGAPQEVGEVVTLPDQQPIAC